MATSRELVANMGNPRGDESAIHERDMVCLAETEPIYMPMQDLPTRRDAIIYIMQWVAYWKAYVKTGLRLSAAALMLETTTACGEEDTGVAFEGLEDPVRKLLAAQIISTFENSTTEIQYGYVAKLGDGRGITAGRAGFTSRTDDLREVVERYCRQYKQRAKDSPQVRREHPRNLLAPYLDPLEKVNGTDSTRGLDGFAAAWAETSASDPLLNRVQDEVVDEWYFEPAMAMAERAGVRTALGQAIIWDTIIQHGGGDADEEPDGLPAIIKEVEAKYGKAGERHTEEEWLQHFLDIRRRHLEYAADPATREAWRESVSRVDALRSILETGNTDLNTPITWEVYGDSFTLK